jgi:hypothetical protein
LSRCLFYGLQEGLVRLAWFLYLLLPEWGKTVLDAFGVNLAQNLDASDPRFSSFLGRTIGTVKTF